MDELKAYIHEKEGGYGSLIFGGLLFFLGGLFLLFKDGTLLETSSSPSPDSTEKQIFCIIIIVVGLFLFSIGSQSNSIEKNHKKSLEDSGIYRRAAKDFVNAPPFANDTFRLGNEFVFRKGHSQLFFYESIAAIEQETSTTDVNHSEIELSLKLCNGNKYFLCKLANSSASTETDTIVRLFQVHNPNIRFYS